MPKHSPSAGFGNLLEKFLPYVFLFWTGFVFFHYFPVSSILDFFHLKNLYSSLGPVDLKKFAGNWVESFKVLTAAVLILFTLWRWGRAILIWLGLELGNFPLRFAVETALGILFFNGLWLGLGLNLLWFELFLWVLALFFLGWSLRDFSGNYLRFQKLPRVEWPGWLFVGLGGLGLLFLTLSIAQAFVPEVYFDSLVYHLAALSFWKFHHGISDFYTNLYAHYPFGAELYFLNGFFFQGTEAAKMLNAFASGLCGLAAAGWVMEEAGTAPGLMVWAMVLSFPLVSAAVWTTQNDVVLALFLVLFFYALTRWAEDKKNWQWAVGAGIFGGGAMAVKYTAVLGIVAGLLALALTHRELYQTKYWPKWGVLKGLLWIALLPWLIKNYFFTGNPLYPYFSSWMGGISLSPGKMAALMGDHGSPFLDGFSFTAWITRILTRDLDKTIAPLLFSFLPFLFLPGKRSPITKYLTVLSGLSLVFGFLVSHQLRLMIPAFILCFILMGILLSDLGKREWTRAWAWVVVGFGFLSFLSLCRLSADYYQGQKIWFGVETRGEFLSKAPQTASYFGITQLVENSLPKSDQILVVGDARGLYYPRCYYNNSVFDDQVLAVLARKEKDGEGIWKRLHQLGIDDLVILGGEGKRLAGQYAFYPLQEGEWKKLDDFIQRKTEPVALDGMNGIYRLRSGPVERKRQIPNLLTFLRGAQ